METKPKRVCWIRVAKNVSYFLVPILFIVLILSIVSVIYVHETGVKGEENDYYQSKIFARDYWSSISSFMYSFYQISDSINNISFEEEIDSEMEEQLYSYDYYSSFDIEFNGENIPVYTRTNSNNFVYFIIDYKQKIVYTNIQEEISYTTVEDLKEQVLSNQQYWVYENGKIETTIDKLNESHLKNTDGCQRYLKTKDYAIYTAVKDDFPYYDSYFGNYILFSIVKNQSDNAIYNIPLCIILLVIMVCVILIGIGKTRDEEGIHLTWFDKWPIEVSVALVILVIFCICGVAFSIGVNVAAIISIISIIIGILTLYIACILLLETIVKRLKSHTFMKTTFIYWFYKKIKLVCSNMKLSLKIGIEFAVFAIINWIIFAISNDEPFLAFVLLMGAYAFSFIYLLKRAIWNEKIHSAIEKIYKGDSNFRLNTEEYKGELKQVAEQVNDIAGGLSNAIEEKMKSERLKTELITNVSHDIKTPLTSIINYVDLLKKEDITTEKAAEYLTILDNKSQRLKKLTEDLVEASKASSGNIKMNMEKLEVNELIKQVSAEFEDKFKAHGLEEITTFTEEPVHIKADNRYMYRVLENMYSNVSKYAMENSRVYTDIIEHGSNVIIQIKNISKEKLNITADELMQRFVRGDTSRNTEGSGLGLSIANSLTELQGGQFHIYLDGDLFKITIGFKKML